MNQPRGLHVQVRALYRCLLESQTHFDEFKTLLAAYPIVVRSTGEQESAARVRAELNARIAGWLGGNFEGLSVAQVLQWRAIVVADPRDSVEYESDDHGEGWVDDEAFGLERHAG
jgi:hypothetical protein